MKRYELTNETKTVKSAKGEDVTVHRIRAITDFLFAGWRVEYSGPMDADYYDVIKAGTLGGWVESEDNLYQESLAWIMDDAVVFGGATVAGAALVYGKAIVEEYAELKGFCKIFGNAHVESGLITETAKVYDNAHVAGAFVDGRAEVFGNATIEKLADHYDGDCAIFIKDNVKVYENAVISNSSGNILYVENDAEIHGEAKIEAAGDKCLHIGDRAEIFDKAQIIGSGNIGDYAVIKGQSIVKGNITIFDKAVIDVSDTDDWWGTGVINESHAVFAGNAKITSVSDYLVVGPFDNKYDYGYLYATFVADDDKVSLYCICEDRNLVYSENPDADKFRDELIESGDFTEDTISDVLAAYDYAKMVLFKRRRNQKQETADPVQDMYKPADDPYKITDPIQDVYNKLPENPIV